MSRAEFSIPPLKRTVQPCRHELSLIRRDVGLILAKLNAAWKQRPTLRFYYSRPIVTFPTAGDPP